VDIQALNAEIARIVARQAELRKQIDAIVVDLERDESAEGNQLGSDTHQLKI